MIHSFFVEGVPLPAPRPRATSIGGKARIYVPDKVRGCSMSKWRDAIYTAAIAAGVSSREAVPVVLHLHFVIPRAKSHYTEKGNLRKGAPAFPMGQNTGDADNLSKPVMDSLPAWRDDAQVCLLQTSKRFARTDEPPGVLVRIAYGREPLEWCKDAD